MQLLLGALCALALAARGAAQPLPGGPPLAQLDAAELEAMTARLAQLARDVERTLAAPPPAEAQAPAAKLTYLQDALQMSVDAMEDLRDTKQRAPSVALRWRTLRRALGAVLRRAALAAVDYLGALFLIAALTGKAYAFALAYDDTQRLVFGLAAACTTGLSTLPWLPLRALAAPLLLLAMVPPAALLFIVFVLQRVLVVDRALLGFIGVATAAHVAAAAAAPWRALPRFVAATGALFWGAARLAAAALAGGLLLRLQRLTALL